jgi:DNA modification methylase
MSYLIARANSVHIPLKDNSVQCIVTSPPYFGLRDYNTGSWVGGDPSCDHLKNPPAFSEKALSKSTIGKAANTGHAQEGYKSLCGKCGASRVDLQIGLEESPEAYVAKLLEVFRECWRVLKDDGILWLNLGDSYWGGKGASAQAWSTENQDRDTLQQSYHQISGMGETRPTDGKHPFIKPKDLIGIPWMVAFALRNDGWYLRQDIIWQKPNPMPESVTDRCTKSHEYIFILTKSARYFYDFQAILEPANYDGRKDTVMKGSPKYQNGFAPTDHQPQSLAVDGHERWSRKMPPIGKKHASHRNRGESAEPIRDHSGNLDADGNLLGHELDGVPARNKRDVWTVPTRPYKGAHFATFPAELIEPCILAGSRVGDVILDPFNGSGTVGAVSLKYHRHYVGLELNPKYIVLTRKRLSGVQLVHPGLIP